MKLEEFVGNEKTKQLLVDWLNRFYHSKTKDTEPYAIIQGFTGNGKTTLVYALGEAFGVYVHRVTADDISNSDDFNEFIKSLNIQHLTHLQTKKLILIDDFNEFPKRLRNKLYNIYKVSYYPIIYTLDSLDSIASDSYYNDFIKHALVVSVEKPLSSQLYKLLESKSKELGIEADSNALMEIAQKSLTVRSAINSLYTLCTNDLLKPIPNVFEIRKLLLQRRLTIDIDVNLIRSIYKNLNCYNEAGLKLLNLLSVLDVELKVKRKRKIDNFILNHYPIPYDKISWLKYKSTIKPPTKEIKQQEEKPETEKPQREAIKRPISITDYF